MTLTVCPKTSVRSAAFLEKVSSVPTQSSRQNYFRKIDLGQQTTSEIESFFNNIKTAIQLDVLDKECENLFQNFRAIITLFLLKENRWNIYINIKRFLADLPATQDSLEKSISRWEMLYFLAGNAFCLIKVPLFNLLFGNSDGYSSSCFELSELTERCGIRGTEKLMGSLRLFGVGW